MHYLVPKVVDEMDGLDFYVGDWDAFADEYIEVFVTIHDPDTTNIVIQDSVYTSYISKCSALTVLAALRVFKIAEVVE